MISQKFYDTTYDMEMHEGKQLAQLFVSYI